MDSETKESLKKSMDSIGLPVPGVLLRIKTKTKKKPAQMTIAMSDEIARGVLDITDDRELRCIVYLLND